MVFGRKKKKEKTGKEQIDEALQEPKEQEEEALPKGGKAVTKKESEPIGKFSLNLDEMTLAVNALAASEEFKVYQQMVIGQRIAEIIAAYNKAIGGKEESELPGGTEEEPEA